MVAWALMDDLGTGWAKCGCADVPMPLSFRLLMTCSVIWATKSGGIWLSGCIVSLLREGAIALGLLFSSLGYVVACRILSSGYS